MQRARRSEPAGRIRWARRSEPAGRTQRTRRSEPAGRRESTSIGTSNLNTKSTSIGTSMSNSTCTSIKTNRSNGTSRSNTTSLSNWKKKIERNEPCLNISKSNATSALQVAHYERIERKKQVKLNKQLGVGGAQHEPVLDLGRRRGWKVGRGGSGMSRPELEIPGGGPSTSNILIPEAARTLNLDLTSQTESWKYCELTQKKNLFDRQVKNRDFWTCLRDIELKWELILREEFLIYREWVLWPRKKKTDGK